MYSSLMRTNFTYILSHLRQKFLLLRPLLHFTLYTYIHTFLHPESHNHNQLTMINKCQQLNSVILIFNYNNLTITIMIFMSIIIILVDHHHQYYNQSPQWHCKSHYKFTKFIHMSLVNITIILTTYCYCCHIHSHSF